DVHTQPCLRLSTRHFATQPPSTPPIYPLSLHDALPIFPPPLEAIHSRASHVRPSYALPWKTNPAKLGLAAFSPSTILAACCWSRSEEHTSELQSRENLVCRLLLEKKKRGVLGRISCRDA